MTIRQFGWTIPMALLAFSACAPEGGELAEETRRRESEAALRGDSAADSATLASRDTQDATYELPAFVGADTAAQTVAPAATPAQDTVPARPDPNEWTAGVRQGGSAGRGIATLRDVRMGQNAGFDRVVFDFGSDPIPKWHVEYIDRPVRRCGSGDPTPVAGDGWLQVRMDGTQAHDDNGQLTVRQRERQLSFPILREMEMTCDFEGMVEVVLGVSRPNPYRVLVEQNPNRLIVDVRQ